MLKLAVFGITLSVVVIARYITESVLTRYNRAHLTDPKDLLINSGLEFGIFNILISAFWYFCVTSQNLTGEEALAISAVAEMVFIAIKLITVVAVRRQVKGE